MSSTDNPTKEWIDVGELVDGFGGNELQPTELLVGKSFDIHFENGWVITHTFDSATAMTWSIQSGDQQGLADTETYRATNLRDNIFLVDFIKKSERAESVSLVIDFVKNICTAVIAHLPTKEEAERPIYYRALDGDELTPVNTFFIPGSIDAPLTPDSLRHEVTDELIGKRVEHKYGEQDVYEHYYLNPNHYAWHCTGGSEVGLADADRCHYYKIDEQLYLFVWREKVIPTLGLIMVDLQQLKTTGKLCGYKSNDYGELSNGPIGAKLTILSE